MANRKRTNNDLQNTTHFKLDSLGLVYIMVFNATFNNI
jgi:hypothetical protein